MGALLGGCAAAPPRGGRPLHPGERRTLSVPFFPDDTDQCGPAALAGVMSFWGHPIEPAALKKEVYLAHLKGSLPVDLLVAAKKHGFTARFYDGGLEGLKEELKAGRPVIAFLNQGFKFLPMGHYVVVNGFDDARGGLFVHSGLKKDLFVTYKAFMGDWEKTRRTALLILPPERGEAPHAGT